MFKKYLSVGTLSCAVTILPRLYFNVSSLSRQVHPQIQDQVPSQEPGRELNPSARQSVEASPPTACSPAPPYPCPPPRWSVIPGFLLKRGALGSPSLSPGAIPSSQLCFHSAAPLYHALQGLGPPGPIIIS